MGEGWILFFFSSSGALSKDSSFLSIPEGKILLSSLSHKVSFLCVYDSHFISSYNRCIHSFQISSETPSPWILNVQSSVALWNFGS